GEPVAAQKGKPADWLGKRVLLKSPLSKLWPENEKVVVKVRGAVLKIDKVQGADCLVRCIGAEGWIRRNEVVPLDDAIAFFTAQLKANPRNGYALAMRGVARFERHDYEGALTDYNDALKLNKNDSAVLANRGNLWMAQKDLDKALADFNRSL